MAAAGAVAVICVLLFTVNELAGVPLKFTAVAPVNPSPVMVTVREASQRHGGVKPVIKRRKVAMAPEYCEFELIVPPVEAAPAAVTLRSSA